MAEESLLKHRLAFPPQFWFNKIRASQKSPRENSSGIRFDKYLMPPNILSGIWKTDGEFVVKLLESMLENNQIKIDNY